MFPFSFFSKQYGILEERGNTIVQKLIMANKVIKVGTHEGTSPCDWSLRLVPCSVYTKEIIAGTIPLKDLI